MQYSILVSLFFFLLLSFLYFVFIRWKFRCSRKGRLSSPGPTSYPAIGCLISFYKNRHRLLDWYTDMLSESPTKTIAISRFGAPRTIVTSNPRNVEYMLKRNFSNYPKGKPFTEILADFLGKGIFNVDGHLWYNQRKLVIHEFNAQSIKHYSENLLVEEVEKKLMPVLESAADSDGSKAVDLQDLLRRLAFDLVCRVSLGFDPCCLDKCSLEASHPIMEAFDVASEVCARRGAAPLSASWKVKRLFGIGSEKRLKEAIGRIHSFIANVIHNHKKGKDSSGKDLLSKMVSDGEEEEFMRDTIISFVMAGRDTTSAALTWLFYLLSRHPDVENELVREVQDEEHLSTHECLKKLRLLKACISESMRLFPPVAWDSKHAIADDLLPDGTRIRTGDRVTYFPYGMGRMESLWGEDRLDFKPERWICDQTEQGRVKTLKNMSPYKYPVFQAGPRACPGREMAFIQMKYVVASILRRFRIRPASMVTPVFVPLLTAQMAGGFNVFVCRRQ